LNFKIIKKKTTLKRIGENVTNLVKHIKPITQGTYKMTKTYKID
jgi:hypothetical protein